MQNRKRIEINKAILINNWKLRDEIKFDLEEVRIIEAKTKNDKEKRIMEIEYKESFRYRRGDERHMTLFNPIKKVARTFTFQMHDYKCTYGFAFDNANR